MNAVKNFLFVKDLNEDIKKNILKFADISIIILNDLNNSSYKIENKNLYEIIKFCKKNNIKFYISNNLQLALKTKANGLFIKSSNKSIFPKIYKKNFKIIGTAHSQVEYYFKQRQNCNLVFLSPLFFNSKYSINKILGPLRFNLISRDWITETGCLGGINFKNLKKIKLLKINALGFISLIKCLEIKKPAYFLSRRVF